MKEINDIKQLDIETASMESLSNYRKMIKNQLKKNGEIYNQRFQNFPGDYGASICDDYNGEGDEHAQLSNLLFMINEEFRKRAKLKPHTKKRKEVL